MYAKMIPSGMLLPWGPPLISFAFMPKTDEMNDSGSFCISSIVSSHFWGKIKGPTYEDDGDDCE